MEKNLSSRPYSLRRTWPAFLVCPWNSSASRWGQRLPAVPSLSQEPPSAQTSGLWSLVPGFSEDLCWALGTEAGWRRGRFIPLHQHPTHCVEPRGDCVTHQLVEALGTWLHDHKLWDFSSAFEGAAHKKAKLSGLSVIARAQ